MNKRSTFTVILIIVMATLFSGCAAEQEKSITIFAGSASKPALEGVAKLFTEETGIEVILNFSGSGTMLSQMKITQSGDLYIPGSPDYMKLAEEDGVVEPDSRIIIAYLVPAILVQQGNPENIRGLDDLSSQGIDVGIGNPEAVCVGLYAIEVLEFTDTLADIKPNIVTHAESCSKTATLVALKSVDAIIGWRVFSEWHDTIDVVYLEPDQIPRLSYIPAAVSTYAEDPESAGKFLDFLLSSKGQAIFKYNGYLATEEEAREYGPYAQVGGDYTLPEDY